MSDDSNDTIATRVAVATGAAVGSAAIAAALLFMKRRKDRQTANAQPPKTSTAPATDDDADSTFLPHNTD